MAGYDFLETCIGMASARSLFIDLNFSGILATAMRNLLARQRDKSLLLFYSVAVAQHYSFKQDRPVIARYCDLPSTFVLLKRGVVPAE